MVFKCQAQNYEVTLTNTRKDILIGRLLTFNPCIQKGHVITTRNNRKFGAQMKTDAPYGMIDNQTKE